MRACPAASDSKSAIGRALVCCLPMIDFLNHMPDRLPARVTCVTEPFHFYGEEMARAARIRHREKPDAGAMAERLALGE
jgi:hypothetical protein